MKHFKRFIAKIVSFFMLSSDKKKQTYESISEFYLGDFKTLHNFKQTKCRTNSVLLIETNGCHGEVISAYWQYFKNINFNVDILIHNRIYNEHHFSRHNIKNINFFHCGTTFMHKILQTKKIKEYKHIIIMTPMNYTFETQPVLKMFPELNELKNLYIIAHNLPDIENNYKKFNQKHIFALGRRLRNYPCVNPHLFGTTTKHPEKNKVTTFITVGGINPKRKNHTQLINAIKQLVNKGLTFKVIIIGDGAKIQNIDKNILPYIELPGRQISEPMFKYMEQSDFFLTLWDQECKDHTKYRTNQISGSPQLIYGFNKIPIIQKDFADFYDFNTSNAIIYAKDLADAMEKAILMSDSVYKKKWNALLKTSNEIYTESENNLKNILCK